MLNFHELHGQRRTITVEPKRVFDGIRSTVSMNQHPARTLNKTVTSATALASAVSRSVQQKPASLQAPAVYNPCPPREAIQAKSAVCSNLAPGCIRNFPERTVQAAMNSRNPRQFASSHVIQRKQLNLNELQQALENALTNFRNQIDGLNYLAQPAHTRLGLWGNIDWADDYTITQAQNWWNAKKPKNAVNTAIRNHSSRGPAHKNYCTERVANFECEYNDGNKSLTLNYHVRSDAPIPAAPPLLAAPIAAPAGHGWKLGQHGDWIPKDPPKEQFQWGKGKILVPDSRNF